MSSRFVAENSILDRHRSPSATEIYSTARSYLKNTNGHSSPPDSETEKTETTGSIRQDLTISKSGITESHRSERRKNHQQRLKGHRKRTASTETIIPDGFPLPVATERSRSVENILERVDLERSKTDTSILTSADTFQLEYTSDKDEFSSSYKPNSERALLAQAVAQSNTKLMSLSLGRGQTIPPPSQNHFENPLQDSDPQPLDRIENTTQPSHSLSLQDDDGSSIQEYIGQTFPRVKNIDNDVVASDSLGLITERKHSSAQPLPSHVASVTKTLFHTYSQPPMSNNTGMNNVTMDEGTEKSLNYTPPYDHKGRKSKSTQKRSQTNLLNGVSLVSLDSTPNTLQSNSRKENIQKGPVQSNLNMITPTKKPGESSFPTGTQIPLATPPALVATPQFANLSLKEKQGPHRIIDKISLSGSNHPSRSNSPLAKMGFHGEDSEKIKFPTDSDGNYGNKTLQSPDESPDQGKSEPRTAGNDRLLRERLQEAKAMNRQDSANGAVMHQFSLWKGVPKREPLLDIELPSKPGNEASEIVVKETKSDIPTSQKKLTKFRGPRAAIEAQDDSFDSTENVSKYHALRLDPSLATKTTAIHPEFRTHEIMEKPKLSTSPRHQRSDNFEEDDYYDSGNEGDISTGHNPSGSRAYEFRNMVGSCKSNNVSCGSIAESIKTEIGLNMFHGTVDSVDSISSENNEKNSEDDMSLTNSDLEEDAAILGIAQDNDCSFITNSDEEIIRDDTNNLEVKPKIDPIFSSDFSLDLAENIPDYSRGPPPLRKYDKSRLRFDSEENLETGSRTMLVSSSLPGLPSHNPEPIQTVVRRKSASSNHTKKIRNMTSTQKTIAQESIDSFDNPHPRNESNISPSLLSEASSEYDTYDDTVNENENQNYSNETQSNRHSHNHQSIPVTSQQSSANPKFSSKSSTIPHDEIYSIHDFQWKKGNEMLGEGTFGQVYKGMNCSTGELLAVKQICLTDGTEEEVMTLRKEIDLMDSLKHPNIVRYVGTSLSPRYLYIVLEYVPGGSVAGMLSQFGPFSEVLIRRLISQMMQGVDYLHQKGIIHRDIKGANVLVTDTGVAKLADFGCSKQLAGLCTTSLEESMRTIRGSVPWMAPEVIKQTGHGRSADIWSVGATMIEMATGKPPWQEFSNNLAALFHVATSKHPPPVPSELSPECTIFINRCMKIDPYARATARELLTDPFLLALIVTSNS